MTGPADLPLSVVGIAGTFCSPLIFAPLVAELRVSAEPMEFTAVSWMEQPGPWDIPSIARRIADDLRRAKRGPALVVGHSTGGAISLQLALTEPGLVGGLVLVNTGPNMRDHGDIDTILRTIREEGAERILTAVVDRSFATAPPDAVRDDLLEYARRVDPRAALEALASQRDLDFEPLLPTFGCPAAVVHGIHDRVRTVAQAQAFARHLPDGDLTLLNCGHSPPFEAPGELAAVVRRLTRPGSDWPVVRRG